MNNNNSEFIEKYASYSTSKSQKEKVLIRYGQNEQIKYVEKLKSRPQPKDKTSILKKTYWMSIGYTEDEAKNKVSEIQRANSLKRHAKTTKEDYRKQSPSTIDFYLEKGYSYFDAYFEREKFLEQSCCFKREFYVNKHGVEEGNTLFNERYSNRKKTMIEKYGQYVISSGSKSKISLHFFEKLTKELIKNGIKENRIIGGDVTEKEFARTDFDFKRTYFYDYVMLDLKIIIEFNGLFWHARKDTEWKSPWKTFEESITYDKRKKDFIESDGYEVIYVWDDDNFDLKIKEIVDYVKTKLHG